MRLETIEADFIAIVREAGALALKFFREGAEVWDKGGNLGPVTEADLAVDAFLKDRLSALLPEAAWLSEETEDDPARLGASLVWIVDPIDGTRAFVKHKPYFAVSAALIENGAPVLGAVFAPALDELFEARKGAGAKLNGKPIKVGARRDIAGARLIAYRSLLDSKRWSEPWPEVETAMFNSIAYRMTLVADGRFDASVTLNPKSDWDIAAADLIVTEAGGVTTDSDGRAALYNAPDPRHRTVVTANPVLHAALLEKIKEFKPRR